VQLFAARARAVRPTFRLTPENLGAVTAICRRLDGIPLAIELAAARCRALTPDQIAHQLADRFELLSGGSRSALARQRTLEASVMWSIDLLDIEEHRLLERLSVFSGGFTLDAAESVGADEDLDRRRVVDVLTNLVDKSLVQHDEESGRYRSLETIRHFAAQRLLDQHDALGTRDRHAN
jgi:predicted ATPase